MQKAYVEIRGQSKLSQKNSITQIFNSEAANIFHTSQLKLANRPKPKDLILQRYQLTMSQ
jgi:hypothetical protein